MTTGTPEDPQRIATLAERHGFSCAAVAHLLDAVETGGGHMAMFDHPELGGAGQWMRGGMILLGDAANQALKTRVDTLCHELGDRMTQTAGTSAPWQSQTQRSGDAHGTAAAASDPHFDFGEAWWPNTLGTPNATGSSTNGRYAYFAAAGRLALETPQGVEVYDTGDHTITGFAQKQSGACTSIMLTTAHGPVDLSQLHRVYAAGETPARSVPTRADAATAQPAADTDVINLIERLGKLKTKGLLTDEEFERKKAELLARL